MERLLNRIQKFCESHAAKIVFAVILLFFLAISSVIFVRDVIPASKEMRDIFSNTSATEKISLDQEIRLDITLEKNTLEKITVPVYYDHEDEDSKVKVVLKTGNEEIQSWIISFGDSEQSNVDLTLDKKRNIQKGEKYSLLFINEGEYKENTGYLGMAKWNVPEMSVFIDGARTSNDIAIILRGGTYGYLLPMFWGLFIFILVSFCIIWYAAVLRKWKVEKLFVLTGTIVGLIYTIVWSPYSCPDEYVHIATAYYHVNTLMGTEAVDQNGNTLVRPEDMIITPSELTTRKYTYGQMAAHWKDTGVENKTSVSMDWEPMKEVPALSYFPQIFAIFLVRLLGWGNVTWLILGRLFALAVYLAAGYIALKYMPFGKKAMMVLMLGPTAIQEAASFSYDSILNTCSFLFVSYTLYLAYKKKKVTVMDWIVLFVSIILLAPIKIVYLLLAFLIILIPNKKIAKRKFRAYMVKMCLILSSIIVSLFSRMNTTSAMTGDTLLVNGQIIEGYSLKMLLMDPLHTALLWINTIKERSPHYLKQIFGGYEAYSKVEISWLVITAFFIFLVIALLVRDQERLIDFKGRIVSIVISLGILGATLLAFNLAKDCTNLTSDCVYGVQGRYFLPFLPLVIIAIQNKAIVLKRSVNEFLVIGIFYCQILVVWGIFETVIGR